MISIVRVKLSFTDHLRKVVAALFWLNLVFQRGAGYFNSGFFLFLTSKLYLRPVSRATTTVSRHVRSQNCDSPFKSLTSASGEKEMGKVLFGEKSGGPKSAQLSLTWASFASFGSSIASNFCQMKFGLRSDKDETSARIRIPSNLLEVKVSSRKKIKDGKKIEGEMLVVVQTQ